MRHRGDPAPGALGRARGLVLQALDSLTPAAFSWVAPDPESAATSARHAS